MNYYKVFEHFPISEVEEVERTDPDILAGTHEIAYGGLEERFAYKQMNARAFQAAFRGSNQMQQLSTDLAKAPPTAVTAVEGIDIED